MHGIMKRKRYIQPFQCEIPLILSHWVCVLSQTGADGLDPSSGSDDGIYDDEDDVGAKERSEWNRGLW